MGKTESGALAQGWTGKAIAIATCLALLMTRAVAAPDSAHAATSLKSGVILNVSTQASPSSHRSD